MVRKLKSKFEDKIKDKVAEKVDEALEDVEKQVEEKFDCVVKEKIEKALFDDCWRWQLQSTRILISTRTPPKWMHVC